MRSIRYPIYDKKRRKIFVPLTLYLSNLLNGLDHSPSLSQTWVLQTKVDIRITYMT